MGKGGYKLIVQAHTPSVRKSIKKKIKERIKIIDTNEIENKPTIEKINNHKSWFSEKMIKLLNLCQGDKRYHIGNTVGGIVIALYGATWQLHLW